MTKEEIICGLKFTIEMFLLDPGTGETITEPRNDMDKITIDACRGAIELLEQKTMSKEKQIQDREKDRLIGELSKMPAMVVSAAYLYALNYVLYGVDVTKEWLTATQNASVLEKAYSDGYYAALQRLVKRRPKDEINKNTGD